MQLKFNKEIKNKIITISLETANFSPEEIQFIDDLGDPIVTFDKVYDPSHAVKFERRLKTGFKMVQKFDGTINLLSATKAAEQFMEDLETELQNIMSDLRDMHLAMMFEEGQGFIDIKY